MSEQGSSPLVVNALGHHCPVPSLRLRRALETAPPGAEILLLADDPMARIDVPHLVSALGHHLEGVAPGERGLVFTIRTSDAPRPA